MTGMTWHLSVGVLLFTLLPVYLNAASLKFKTKPGPLTYVRLGDTLRLGVSYDFDGTNDVTVTWKFGAVSAVQKVGNNPVQIGDPRATLEGQASLVLKNTSLKDNITFTVTITTFGVPDIESSFQVIIAVKPDALTDCNETTKVNQSDNVGCRCYSTKGNPTPTASWYKDGTLIGGRGISETRLSLNNVKIKDNGTYTCQLQSYNLKSEISVHVFVKFAPDSVEIRSDKTNNIAALGTKVIIRCVANGYPIPTYTIVLNGTKNVTGVVDGVKTIDEATYEDAGLYECVAENNLGKKSSSFTLRVQATVPTTTSKPATGEMTSNPTEVGTDGEGDSGGLGTGAIVGIVVGVLFLIVVVVALVYWFCIKQNECCCACCVLGGKDDRSEDDRSQNENPAEGYVREDNPYASVDEERERPDKGASTSRNQARPAAEMPPVYAAVDKTKKNKKPPPDAQPALTYASLDPVILQPDSSKMRDRSREETNYAAIDLEKLQSDLV